MSEQNCLCVKINYQLIGESPQTFNINSLGLDINGYNYYSFTIPGVTFPYNLFQDPKGWQLENQAQPNIFEFALPGFAECPFGVYESTGLLGPLEAFSVEICGVVPPTPTPPTPEDLELINHFRLKVWSKQCKYSKCVMEYVNNLIFGVDVCKLQESLKEQRRVLKILNCYDPRDILNNTTIYNTIPYNKIKKLLD
jgi:hypothetical protein